MKQLLETLGRVIEKLILKKDRDKLQDLLMHNTPMSPIKVPLSAKPIQKVLSPTLTMNFVLLLAFKGRN